MSNKFRAFAAGFDELQEFTIEKEPGRTDHKAYGKLPLGYSDIASLILRSMNEDGQKLGILDFGGDGCYNAYIVDADAKIPERYSLVFKGHNWLWVYSDSARVAEFDGRLINVYRAGGYGCVIQIID